MTEEQARAAAGEFRQAATMLRERASALRRLHLVWWEGPAAEEYSRRVRDRVAGLELRAEQVETVAVLLEHVAELVRGTTSLGGSGPSGWAVPA